MMKTVVLDGYVANPGDLSWAPLEEFGEVVVYERSTDPEELPARCQGADVLITNKTVLREPLLKQLPQLKMISVLATGYNVVDVKAARSLGIDVCNVPGYSTDSVAQLVFALMLEYCHHVQRHTDAVKAGAWVSSTDFCFWHFPLMELKDKTLGIVGYGAIGKAVERIALAFGMKVLKCASTPREGCVSLEEVIRGADFITVHCPLTEKTHRLINRETISWMKPTAFLINTARGGIIDDEALAEALREGRIAGAALDVLGDVEPPVNGNPLLQEEKCFITPHLAWATLEARQRLMQATYENVAAFAQGKPVNVVN